MTDLLPQHQRWLGADTHSDFHVLAITDGNGHLIHREVFTTDPDQIQNAADWALKHQVQGAGVEGTSSYGATLTAALMAAQIPVVEVTRANRQDRRANGKTDDLDAIQAAEAVRTGRRISPVKSHPLLMELRCHYALRTSALTARTQVGNEIQSFLKLIGAPGGAQSPALMQRVITQHPTLAAAAQRWLNLDAEAKHYLTAMTTWLKQHAPEILEPAHIGPVSATQLILASGLNPQRTASEAGFARLCGLAPIPVRSGRNQHTYRLSRSGDRDANQAFWRIAFGRSHTDQRTIAYLEKRARQRPHETKKSALRNLKRHLCREITPILHLIAKRHTPTT